MDGIPLNLDGAPLKGDELDGVPLAETALDGMPLAEEDIDGLPCKSPRYYVIAKVVLILLINQ